MAQSFGRINDMILLHPAFRAAVEKVVAELAAESLPFRIFESFRTPERQSALYAQGRTAPGPRVTKARPWSSYHQYGFAVDFVLFIDGKWSWKSDGAFAAKWARLHEIGRKHGLEPLSWEMPHLQYAATSIERLRAGEFPAGGDIDWAENLQAVIAGWSGPEKAPPPPKSAERPSLSDQEPDDEAPEIFAMAPSSPAPFRDIPERGLTVPIILAAQASRIQWGVPASITLAQFVLESAGGKRMPPGSNNPFGIKARSGEPFVQVMTGEVVGGREVIVSARFRKYASMDEAFSDHGRLLATSPYYRNAMRNKDDPVAFAHALTGVYATDPNYGDKLVRLINDLQLGLYDEAAAPNPVGDGAAAAVTAPVVVVAAAMRFGDSGENVRALQEALKKANYGVGEVDGRFGSLTRAALLAFQADNGLPTTGVADSATMARLNDAPPRPLEPGRVAATEEDLRKKGSKTVIDAGRTRLLGILTSVMGAFGIGSSVVVNSVGTTAGPTPFAGQPIEDFLQRASTALSATTTPDPQQMQSLANTASDLLKGLHASASPEVAGAAARIVQVLPQELMARYPELEAVLTTIASGSLTGTRATQTIFDLLPSMFAHGTNLELIARGLASVGSSLLPGLGGSTGALIVGLLIRYFSNQISSARVQDHQDASNVGH